MSLLVVSEKRASRDLVLGPLSKLRLLELFNKTVFGIRLCNYNRKEDIDFKISEVMGSAAEPQVIFPAAAAPIVKSFLI